MSTRPNAIWLSLALIPLLSGMSGRAQVQNGSVTGTIADPSGAVLPRARVTALSITTGTQYGSTTTSSGEYTFPRLRSPVPVEVGQRQVVNFKLQLGSTVETVQVTSSIPPLETQSASPGTVVVNRYVQDLPLSIRNWDDLMGLAARVSADRYTNQSGATNSGRYGDINIHGVRSLQNNFILEGVDNNSVSENVQELSTESVRPSVDAIAEFKMVTDP